MIFLNYVTVWDNLSEYKLTLTPFSLVPYIVKTHLLRAFSDKKQINEFINSTGWPPRVPFQICFYSSCRGDVTRRWIGARRPSCRHGVIYFFGHPYRKVFCRAPVHSGMPCVGHAESTRLWFWGFGSSNSDLFQLPVCVLGMIMAMKTPFF